MPKPKRSTAAAGKKRARPTPDLACVRVSPPPLTSEEALQRARAEGLTLLVAENQAGYFGVAYLAPAQHRPYRAAIRRGDTMAYLGRFATPEEAALHVARLPEGKAAAKKAAAKAAAPPPPTSEQVQQQARAEGLELCKAENQTCRSITRSRASE